MSWALIYKESSRGGAFPPRSLVQISSHLLAINRSLAATMIGPLESMSFRSNTLNRSLATTIIERVLAPERMSSRSHILFVDCSLAAITIERV